MMDDIHDAETLSLRIDGIAAEMAEQAGDTVPAVSAVLDMVRRAGITALRDRALSVQAARLVGRICASTAWLVAENAEAHLLVNGVPGSMSETCAKDIVVIARDPDFAELKDNVLSGRWSCVGGIAHADWLLLTGIAGADGRQRAALVPASRLVPQGYPYLGGLRGLGWTHVAVEGMALSEGYVAPLDLDIATASGLGANRLLGPVVGCAEGGYQDYVRMTKKRITGIGGASVAGFSQVQSRLAESDAELGGVGAMFDALVMRLDEGEDARAQRDRAYISRKALDAVTRLIRQMGAIGLMESNPVQRRYRDLRTLASDRGFAWDDQMAAFGRQLLGVA